MESDLEETLTNSVLVLEEIDENLYRASNLWRPHHARGAFGGQIVGQALAAAGKTVADNLTLHSMHNYFIRAGDSSFPVIYNVTRTRDGASFSSRTVVAIQRGKPILTLQASYHNDGGEVDVALQYQTKMPDVKHHSELLTSSSIMEAYIANPNTPESMRKVLLKSVADEVPIEVKPLEPEVFLRQKSGSDRQAFFWVRAKGHVGENQNLNRCIAAYLSDWALLWTALVEHPRLKIRMMASLDHSMWFHAPFRTDEWMLYETAALVSSANRTLCTGRLWKEDGTLAVVIAQEGVIRAQL